MIWVVLAVTLVLWLAGAILRVGAWANLLLLAAAVMLAYQILQERRSRNRDR